MEVSVKRLHMKDLTQQVKAQPPEITTIHSDSDYDVLQLLGHCIALSHLFTEA